MRWTGYKTKRWERLRETILRRDGYRCREAARYGLAVQADTVHHVWPVEDFPQFAWEPWNLIALSHKAHNEMHDRVTGALTEKGEAWRRRTIPPPMTGPLAGAHGDRRGDSFRRREGKAGRGLFLAKPPRRTTAQGIARRTRDSLTRTDGRGRKRRARAWRILPRQPWRTAGRQTEGRAIPAYCGGADAAHERPRAGSSARGFASFSRVPLAAPP